MFTAPGTRGRNPRAPSAVHARHAFGGSTSIPSAGTVDLRLSPTIGVLITGTTTITSFGTGANLWRIIKFAGILTLTHNATSLILPNAGSNITTAAGDRCTALSDGSGNWTVVAYQRADGSPLAGGVAGSSGQVQYNNGGVAAGAAGLVYAGSGSNLTVTSQNASDKPLVVKGAASQSGNLQEWQNSSGTALGYINSSGIHYTTNNGLGFVIAVSGQTPVGIGRNSSVAGLDLFADTGGNAQVNVSTSAFLLNSGMSVAWSQSAVTQPIDTALKRAAAKVVSVEAASSAGGTLRFISTSPSQITADQNNYAPGGTSYFQRWNTDASRNITGLSLSQVDGQPHMIVNVGSNNIVLVHQSASSTAANRFLNSTGADITLSANQAADLVYDNTQSRWLVFKRN